jgi:hypothetical protein
MDTAYYQVTHGVARVDIALERRLGNATMFISIMPAHETYFRRDDSSDRLAKRIAKLLVANDADASPKIQT